MKNVVPLISVTVIHVLMVSICNSRVLIVGKNIPAAMLFIRNANEKFLFLYVMKKKEEK